MLVSRLRKEVTSENWSFTGHFLSELSHLVRGVPSLSTSSLSSSPCRRCKGEMPSRSLTSFKYHLEKNFPGFKWFCPFFGANLILQTNCKPSHRIVSPCWMKVLGKVYLEENKMEFYILRWRIFVKCTWCYKLFFYFPAWPCKIVDCSISSCYWGGHFFFMSVY